MSVNRYTVFQPQEYVETYVPLPLDFINQQGAMKQADLDKHKKAVEDDTDPISKIGNLSFTLKSYDRKGNIIDQSNTELEEKRLNDLKNLSAEREQLASDLATGKISDVEFKTQSFKHIKKAADTYNQLAGYKTNIDAIAKANEEYSKSKDFGLDQGYGTDMLEYNTKYLEDVKNGTLNPYAQQAIAKEFNIQDAIKNFTFKDSGGNKVNIGNYITSSGTTGVKAERVRDAAERVFSDENSDVYRNAKRSLMHDIRLNPSSYKTDADINKAWEEKKLNFILAAVDEHAGEIYTESAKNNSLYNQKLGRTWELEDRMSEVQTVPSDLEVNSYTKFAEANPGLVTKDGKIDWVGVMKNPSGTMSNIMDIVSSVFTPNPATAISGILAGLKPEKTPTEKAAALNGLMKETAKIVGYMGDGSGKISSKDYQNIMDIYKNFTNLRGTAIGYNAEQSDVYTNRLEQVPDNYIYTNEKGEVLSDELRNEVIGKIRASKSKELSEKDAYVAGKDRVRIGENKQTSFVEKIKLSDGSTVYAQPQFKEEKGHYDQLANIFDNTDQYLSTGELVLPKDPKEKSTLLAEVPKGMTNVSSITKLPTGDVIIGQTFKSASGPIEQYFIKDAYGNMSPQSRTASELAQLYHSQFDQSNIAPKNAARKVETVKNYTTTETE